MQTLKDKVVLITGANRGIGKSLVQASLKRNPSKIYATSRKLENIPDFGDERVIPLRLDISNKNQVQECAKLAGDTTVLINNAGILEPGSLLDGDREMFQYNMDINYFSNIHMMRAFAPILEKNAPAKLVNIVSIVAYSPLSSIAGYSASKAALYSATLSARTELAHKGVMVHAVNPGAIDTDMNKGSDWEMPSPDPIAELILDGVEQGKLDIVPDQMGKGMYEAWQEDPLQLAKIFHDLYYGVNP